MTGYNAVTEGLGPLPHTWVELTGRSLRDGVLLVPPRTGLTDGAGLVTFKRLPAIAWEAHAFAAHFHDIVPGSYTFTAAHARNTFTGSGITIEGHLDVSARLATIT